MNELELFFKLGLTHVLDWQAYDHVLFLIVLTVSYTFDQWKRILLLVTVFTIGHTISMLIATFWTNPLGSSLVEFLIPITIFVTALFNVFTAGKGANKTKGWLLIFSTLFFGLIHGLGFSTYYKQISVGASSKLIGLFEFALGIEAAQLIVVFILLIIGFVIQTIFRFSKRDWIMVVSSIVIGMVIPMLLENEIW